MVLTKILSIDTYKMQFLFSVERDSKDIYSLCIFDELIAEFNIYIDQLFSMEDTSNSVFVRFHFRPDFNCHLMVCSVVL